MSDTNPSSADAHRLKVQQHFMAHQQSLLAYTLSLVPNLQDAQDILQEVFLVISRKSETWSDGTNFFAWACAITRFEVFQHARTSQKRVVPIDDDVLQLLETPDPAEDDLQAEITRLKECLKRLSPRTRELLLQRYHAAQMPEAIAKSMNWSVNSVRVALTRAKQALRDCLTQKLALEDPS